MVETHGYKNTVPRGILPIPLQVGQVTVGDSSEELLDPDASLLMLMYFWYFPDPDPSSMGSFSSLSDRLKGDSNFFMMTLQICTGNYKGRKRGK